MEISLQHLMVHEGPLVAESGGSIEHSGLLSRKFSGRRPRLETTRSSHSTHEKTELCRPKCEQVDSKVANCSTDQFNALLYLPAKFLGQIRKHRGN